MKIPNSRILNSISITWKEFKYGVDNGYIDISAAFDKANADILVDKESKELIDLLILTKDDDLTDALEDIIQNEAEGYSEDLAQRKWLYLTLDFVFSSQDKFEDPLGEVEQIYADFDYPERIEKFVKYMPMVGPDLGSKQKNSERLFDYWKEYLDSEANYFVSEAERKD